MTEQAYLHEISLLKKENAALKKALGQGNIYKEEWTDRMTEAFGERSYDAKKLTRIIRSLCFRKDVQPRKCFGKDGELRASECTLRAICMSDEEFERYENIMCEVLSVLKKYKYEEATNE